MRIVVLVRVLLSHLHSWCYVAQHLKSGPLPVCAHYVTSMATVLSAILLRAGLSSSWLSLWGQRGHFSSRLAGFWKNDRTKHIFWLCIKKSPAISTSHRGLRSTLEAPETLGICRLAVADSFKAADGTLPRVRGMWRPARLVAVGTLRQMLLPMRTWVLEGVELLVVPQPRIPRAAVVWALGVEESEDGTTVAGEGEVELELEEGCRKVGAAEVVVFVDWLTWWRVVGVLARWRPL